MDDFDMLQCEDIYADITFEEMIRELVENE